MKFFSFGFLFLFLFSLGSSAQEYLWTQTQSGSSLGGPIDVEKYNPDNVYYGTSNRVYKSTDRGETFQQMGTTIPNSSAVKCVIVSDNVPGTLVVAVESSPNDKIFKTTDSGLTWVLTNDEGSMSYFGIPVTQDPTHPDTLYTMIGAAFKRSTDFGSTWTTIASNFGPVSAPCDIEVFQDTSIILIGDNGTGIFRSTDYGTSWNQVYSTSGEIPTVAVDLVNPGIAWATKWGGGGGFLKSTDFGATWTPISTFNGINMWGVHVNPLDGKEVYTGCYSCGSTWRTKDEGLTWRQINIPSSNYQVYVVDSMTVFSAQGNGFYKLFSPYFIPVELTSFTASVLDGKINLTWSTSSEINNSGFEIERKKITDDPENYWEKIGFVDGKGTTTEKQIYNFLDLPVEYGSYSYRLKQIDFDGTTEFSEEIEVDFIAPSEFQLKQNYPNPFNPSTKISWQIAKSSFVVLKIYDLLGNEVVTLVNEEKPAGIYEVEFDASSLSSGTYFYRLTSENFSQTKKMSLIK
jgi:photosystem II stability/assembly factor-like uncharacterized protein